MVEDGPVGSCRFCGGTYLMVKLAVHEGICIARPANLSVRAAVHVVLRNYPAAIRNKALLLRKVWELRDGYTTPEPNGKRLSDPLFVLREASRGRPGSEK